MFLTRQGKLVDGDAVMYIVGRRMKAMGHLPGDRVIATVMSNLGLEVALRREGITLGRTSVGDKYVLEEMVKSGAALGGEQSGHVIFSEYATTGDGLLTALKVLEAVVGANQPLDQLAKAIENYPQTLLNVKIRERKPLGELAKVQEKIAACEQDFGENGRVLVRFSGTEPLARVMVEGNSEAKVKEHAAAIAAALEESIGA
jgi:phosphoglucosamine mutase